MQNKIKLFNLLIFISIFLSSCVIESNWKILIYMESGDNLSHAAIKNITDLALGYQNHAATDAQVFVQLHSLSPDSSIGQEAYRYQVTKVGLKVDSIIQLSTNQAQDLIDAGKWAFGNVSKTDSTMLVLWNHGFGVLNPILADSTSKWHWTAEHDELMNYSCLIRHKRHKALMFQADNKTYMTVTDVAQALNTIRTNYTHRNIDIIGFDMCMMAMVEICYELAPYVNYAIGSQDCELEYGWDYYALGQALEQQKGPVQLGRSIIESYANFYAQHGMAGTYTSAFLNLSTLDALKNNIDQVSTALKACQEQYGPKLLLSIKKLRLELPRFCLVPMYTDLKSFYQELTILLEQFETCNAAKQLKNYLEQGKKLIEQTVVANCVGKNRSYANGISIYLPYSHFDTSYDSVLFAQQSQWTNFIKNIISIAAE